ncbi:hypothetical protein [Erythrobacter sp. YT30]|uniref:hypothetical protein n=1 Tax=Erythrobacter sp. YT30 TaxID=1735012 RepID=UPI000B269561|nr:hypothetical protein [Erythrobacter sp. YT30]
MPFDPISPLIERLEDLVPTDHTRSSDLHLARRLIAQDIRREAIEGGIEQEDLKRLDEEISATVGDLEEESLGRLIDRSRGGAIAVPFPGLGTPKIAVDLPDRLGPFRSPLGDVIDLGRLLPAQWDAIGIDGSDAPGIFVPKGGAKASRTRIKLKFEDGTLWVRTDLLVSEPFEELDEKTYVSIPVAALEGSLKSQRGMAATDPMSGKLAIKLRYPAGPIEVYGDIALHPPKELEIAFDGSGKTTFTMSQGSVKFGDETIELKPIDSIAFDPQHTRLIFLAKPDPNGVDLSNLSHVFAKGEGGLSFAQTGWALPTQLIADPAALAQMAPTGGWVFQLKGAADVSWEGLEDPVSLQDPWFECAIDNWILDGFWKDDETRFPLEGWLVEGGRQRLDLDLPTKGRAAIGSDPANGHFATFIADLEEVFSHPIDAEGKPARLGRTRVTALISQGDGKPRRIGIKAVSSPKSEFKQFVIENAVFQVDASELAGIEGTLDTPVTMDLGRVRLRMRALGWYPILPDPYVANFGAGPIAQRPTTIVTDVRWNKEKIDVSFTGGFHLLDATQLRPSDPQIVGTDINPDNLRKGGLTHSGRALRSEEQLGQFERQRRLAGAFKGSKATQTGRRSWIKESERFRQVGLRMLDVSTNRDQIGVALKIGSSEASSPPIATHAGGFAGAFGATERSRNFRVSGMSMVTLMSDVRVFALPQIQWEPVRTLDVDQDLITLGYFPTPLASADDGGATQITSEAPRLAPVIPDLTVQSMVDAFDDGEPMQMVTTLPFGISALLKLRPTGDSEQHADQVRRVEPTFEAYDMTGGLQLAFEAGESQAEPPYMDPGFRGYSYQWANGVDLETGARRNISVLGSVADPDGSVEALFNQEFLLSRPRVPVNRLDISGYGASMFSDWRNPFAAFAEAAKVEFQVTVGRTVLEIVKFVSVLYPWGIRVTRSVTIERGSGAGVVRRDTGWQATSPGLLDFRYVPEGEAEPVESPYVMHPGLLRGVFDVERIRPADRGRIDLPSGGAVLPMMFDADFEIGTDSKFVRAPSKGVLGFLHLEPVGEPISSQDLDDLIETMGPVGGPLNVDLEIDNSRMTCRIVRAEIAASQSTSGPVLAGAITGLPEFSNAGSWSVAAFAGPGAAGEPQEARTVDEGVSLVRRGMSGPPRNGRIHVPTPDPHIRFADAADLFATSPERDYAFLQTCPTHTFAYRRPSIEIGAQHIDAGLPPLFADVMVRTTGGSIFPPEDIAITLPASTELVTDTGVPRLGNPISMSITRGPVTLSDSDIGGGKLEYRGASLWLEIGATDWCVKIPHVEIQNTILGIENVSALRLDIMGGSGRPNRLENVVSVLGGFFADIFDVIPGFGSERDVPSQDLRATNAKYKVKFKYSQIFGGKLAKVGPGSTIALYAKIWGEFGVEKVSVPDDKTPPEILAMGEELSVTRDFLGAGVGFEARGEVPFSWGLLVIALALDLGYSRASRVAIPGTSSTLPAKTKATAVVRVEVGAGVGKKLGPFEAKGYLIGIFLFAEEGEAISYGVGLRGEFKADLRLVKVKIYIEILGIYLLEPPKKFIVGQAEIGINVKVAAFISIKYSFTAAIKKEVG